MRRLGIVLTLLLAARAAAAQDYVARGDALFSRGRVFAAETLYYYAVSRQSHEPAARLALGRYLAARGALRVGAVLMEEALYFGGDRRAIAAQLAPVYARLGDYRKLATLSESPLSYAERARAEWLAEHASEAGGVDSATVAYAPVDSGLAVGRVRIAIGADTVDAAIEPGAQGLALDTTWARRPQLVIFKSRSEREKRKGVGVAPAVSVGTLSLANVPVRFEALGSSRRARVGLDVLGALAPTFDPARRQLTLRSSGRVSDDLRGDHVPTVMLPTGLFLIRAGLHPLTGAEVRPAIRAARWTVNARRGEVVLER